MADGQEVGKISIRVVPDLKRFYGELKRGLEAAEKNEVKIDVDADLKRFRSKVAAAVAKMPDAEIDVTADTRAVRKQLAKVADDASGIKLELDPKFDYRIRQRLRKIKPKVEVDLDFDRRAMRGLSDMFSGGLGGFKNLRGLVPSFGTGVNPAGMAAIAAAISALVVPAIGLLSSALTAIPALVAGIATPIAAVTLGLDGIKKAAETLREPFEALKRTMSAAFERRMIPIFNQLKSIFPVLERSMPGVANGLSDMLQGVTDSVTGDGMGAIERTIANIGTALSNTAPGVKLFTDNLLSLTDKVAEKFPGLASGLTGLGERFGDWVTKISSVGPDGTSQLDTALSNLKNTMGELFGLVTDMAAVGFEWMADPRFGEVLEGFAADLRSIVNELLPEMKNAFEDVASVINGISVTLEKMRDWAPIKDADGEGNLWDSFLQGIPIIGSYIGMAQGGFGETAAAADGVAQSVENIGAAAKSQTESLREMFGAAAGAGVKSTTGPGAEDIVGALESQITAAPAPVLPPVDTEAAKAEVQAYSSFVDSVTSQVKGALSQGLTGESLPAPNFEAFKSAWTGLSTFVTTEVDKVKAAAATTATALNDSFTGVETSIRNSLSGLAAAVAPTWEGMRSGAQTAFDQIQSRASELPGQIESALSGLAAVGESAGAALVNGLINGINSRKADAVAAAADMAAAVESAAKTELAIKSPSRVFHQIGQDVAHGLENGLSEGFTSVLDRATGMSKKLTDAFGPGQEQGQSEGMDWQRWLDIPKGFADATASQLISDLGGTGSGMVPELIRQGIGVGEQFIFNVSSMDEALAGKQNITNKKALQYKSR